MTSTFTILGVLVGRYALYAALKGEVYAKSRVWGKVVPREESPHYFWTIITIYAGLAVALVAVF